MAVNIAELLALPFDERVKIAEALVGDVPEDLEPLIQKFAAGLRRTNVAIEATISRLENFNARVEQSRAEVRQAVLQSGESWPFAVLPEEK